MVHDDIRGRDPELVAHDLGEGRLVALPLALDPELEDGLPGGHDGELRRVEHLDAQQVVVLTRAGPGDLGEARHPDADEPAPAAALLLLLAQLLVAGLLESEVEHLTQAAACMRPQDAEARGLSGGRAAASALRGGRLGFARVAG